MTEYSIKKESYRPEKILRVFFGKDMLQKLNKPPPKWKRRLNWQYWYHPWLQTIMINFPTHSFQRVSWEFPWNLTLNNFHHDKSWVAQVWIPLGNPEAHPSRLASTAIKASLGKESLRPRRNVGNLCTAPCSSRIELLLIVDCNTQKIGYTNSCCDSFRMDHLTLQSFKITKKNINMLSTKL